MPHARRSIAILLGIVALGVGVLLGSGMVMDNVVQAQSEAPVTSGADDITADEVNAVAREIWCPLCSGVRLDACELKACDQMKEVIAIKLSEGEDTESIVNYFVDQYGPQVLGEPPREGFNWLAWILPVVAAVAGGYIFWRTTQRMVQPASVGVGPVPQAGRPSGQSAPGQSASPVEFDDEYEQKLEEELAKYG